MGVGSNEEPDPIRPDNDITSELAPEVAAAVMASTKVRQEEKAAEDAEKNRGESTGYVED